MFPINTLEQLKDSPPPSALSGGSGTVQSSNIMSAKLDSEASSNNTISNPNRKVISDEPKIITLPGDILLQICEELGTQLEFGVLFNCAISGKELVSFALLWLYR